MALADYAAYKARVAGPREIVHVTKNAVTAAGGVGRLTSTWTVAALGGSAPSTAAAPTRTLAGAFGQVNSGTVLRLVRAALANPISTGAILIADRLSHQGGLSGTTTGAQTTNLPTAALTRSTTGVGVWATLEIYTAIGSTATTVTASYTNTVPTSGQTTIATAFGGTNDLAVGRVVPLPLAQGDLGVRAVASVTLAASTLTAGNFGVTLIKPLLFLCAPNANVPLDADALLNWCGNIPAIDTDACLCAYNLPNASPSGAWVLAASFAEE